MSLTLEKLARDTADFGTFPTAKTERWRFSQIEQWLQKPFKVRSPHPRKVSFTTPYEVTLENAKVSFERLPDGAELMPCKEAGFIHAQNPFGMFNRVYAAPLRLRLSKSPDAPLHIRYRYGGGFSHCSLSVELAEGVEAVIIESVSGTGFITQNVTYALERKSCLDVTQLQLLERDAVLIWQSCARLETGAEQHSFTLFKGAGLHQHFARTELGEAAVSELDALLLADTDQRHVLCADMVHQGDRSRSAQAAREILSGSGVGVYDAKVVIERGTRGAEAVQSSHALLLSREAQIHAKPHMEIYTDELSASHGATVGELDEAALWYMQSRGIGEAVARRMLTRAFAENVIATIRHEAVRALVETLSDSGEQPDE